MMDFAPADLSSSDPRLMLRKRLREEMEVLRGILRKAELLVGRTVDNGRAEPRRRKDGRFLAAEDRSVATGAGRRTCAKRRKTIHVAEIVEPRMSKDEISSLVTRVSSLSENMPAHILEFLKKECTGHADENGEEMEIDLGSMRHAAMYQLRKLLDEFAEDEKHQQVLNTSRPISRSPQREQEDGEIVEEEDCNVTIDTCSYASPVAACKVLCSPQRLLEDGEVAEEEDVVCRATAPVATEDFAEAGSSPSSSSSKSSSGSSSSSGCSSGRSCSDSSDFDSSDSERLFGRAP
ncbi:hypothetical protein BAE44_0004651 [Dichanthelium oligosanthes]|uniref:NET domain-containing protein n=1 Tax=Dichanthelium oligosanthes TaxID=888268 RepID=A0A1E5WAQ8_9POAL|nr:hypothetical protein BAE44_0004651 [Dichanthelium oligosanthes]